MKITDIYRQRRTALSFEVYPSKTDAGRVSMLKAIERLAEYRPGFVSCTYGAGGSTRRQTLEIVTDLARRYGVTTTAHLTCVGATAAELHEWLREAVRAGVENIMALRGDPPQGQETFKPVEGGLRYANELVSLIRADFPKLGIGVAGYPETHQEAASTEADLENLKRKVGAGADAVFTQLFYNNADYFRFRDRCEMLAINVPIVPGILPITSYPQVQRITKLCKAKIPASLSQALEGATGDAASEQAVGIDHATRQCEELIRQGVPGIHFYVLNKSEATAAVLDNLNWDSEMRRAA